MTKGSTNAAVELLSRNLLLHPEKVAYFCGDRSLTYRELDRASRGVARYIQNEGIAPGERVVIALPDCLAFPSVFLGCLLSGAVAVAVGADSSGDDLSFICEDSEARLFVTHKDLHTLPSITDGIKVIYCGHNWPPDEPGAGDAVEGLYQPSDDDMAYMLYSSGTTGRPKGVPHFHRSLLLPCELVGRAIFGITDDDVIFSTSKLSFTYGLINSLAFPLFFGATAILLQGKPEPETILGIVGQRWPSNLFLRSIHLQPDRAVLHGAPN